VPNLTPGYGNLGRREYHVSPLWFLKSILKKVSVETLNQQRQGSYSSTIVLCAANEQNVLQAVKSINHKMVTLQYRAAKSTLLVPEHGSVEPGAQLANTATSH
jgi:hypothetical protein